MSDEFELDINHVSDPAVDGVVITPSDTLTLTRIPKAIYVGTGGDISIIGSKGTTSFILKNVPSGSMLPIRVKQIKVTGTTASDIIGLY